MRSLFDRELRRPSVERSRRKAAADVAKELRFDSAGGQPLQLLRAIHVASTVLAIKGQSVRMPGPEATPKRITALAVDIHRFIMRTCSKVISAKNAAVYTAAVLSLLQTGYTHNDVTLIPVIPWVATSAPGAMHYSIVKTVGCRAVSIAIRTIKANLVSEGSHALVAKRYAETAEPSAESGP